MSLLINLPDEFEGIPIHTDFRNGINISLVIDSKDMSDFEKNLALLNLVYDQIPSDLEQALRGVVWFYMRGKLRKTNDVETSSTTQEKIFSFEEDAPMILASFQQAYHIDLTAVDYLHWWHFMSLFECLPQETMMKQALTWRCVDINSLKSKEEKQRAMKMKAIFSLEGKEYRNENVRERALRRYSEVMNENPI